MKILLMSCCLSEIGSMKVESINLVEKSLELLLREVEGEAMLLGEVLQLVAISPHLGVVHEEVDLDGVEVLRQQVAQHFALFVEQ